MRPDFARTDLSGLSDSDLRFLVENFPRHGRSYEEMSRVVHHLPTTVESMLSSAYVLQRLLDRRDVIVRISPFLLFNALLRSVLPKSGEALERSVINYVANVLALFVRTDRLFRVDPGDEHSHEHLVDLIDQRTSADPRRQFLAHAHAGNYSLYLSGWFADWLEHRHRYGRRAVSPGYYSDVGRDGFQRAASHPLARGFRLDDVFLRLALGFDLYRGALRQLSRRYCQAND